MSEIDLTDLTEQIRDVLPKEYGGDSPFSDIRDGIDVNLSPDPPPRDPFSYSEDEVDAMSPDELAAVLARQKEQLASTPSGQAAQARREHAEEDRRLGENLRATRDALDTERGRKMLLENLDAEINERAFSTVEGEDPFEYHLIDGETVMLPSRWLIDKAGEYLDSGLSESGLAEVVGGEDVLDLIKQARDHSQAHDLSEQAIAPYAEVDEQMGKLTGDPESIEAAHEIARALLGDGLILHEGEEPLKIDLVGEPREVGKRFVEAVAALVNAKEDFERQAEIRLRIRMAEGRFEDSETGRKEFDDWLEEEHHRNPTNARRIARELTPQPVDLREIFDPLSIPVHEALNSGSVRVRRIAQDGVGRRAAAMSGSTYAETTTDPGWAKAVDDMNAQLAAEQRPSTEDPDDVFKRLARQEKKSREREALKRARRGQM
jgi:hypothetical protein